MSSEVTKSPETSGKSSKAAMLLIFLTVFIDLVGFGLIIPVLPTYAHELKASDTVVGLLIASYSIMQFVFTPFWGRLSDKLGRRPILLISLLASSIGYLIWGFSNSLELLFLSRIVAGFGNANIAVAQAYITDITTQENRAKGMGLVGAAFGLGFVIGPAIGGLCVGIGNGLQTVGLVAAGFSILDLVLTFFLLPEPKNRSAAGNERFGGGINFYFECIANPKLTTSLAIFFLSTFAFANMEATLVLLTQKQFNFTPQQNSLMFTYIGLLIVFVQGGLIHRLSRKHGEKNLISLGAFLTAIGLILTPITANLYVLYGALALLAFGQGMNTPANQSMLSKLAPQEKVGGVMGVGQSLSTLGRILGPAIGCFLFEKFGTGTPYALGGAAMVLVVVLSFMLPTPASGPGSPDTDATAGSAEAGAATDSAEAGGSQTTSAPAKG